MVITFRKKKEEAVLSQTLKEARIAAHNLEEEKKRVEEQEKMKIENMRVTFL